MLQSGCGMWGCSFLMRPLLAHGRHTGHEAEQQGFQAARIPEPETGSCTHMFLRSCGKTQKPRFHKHLVKAHRGQGGEGAPMNQVNHRGLSGLLLRTEQQSPRALRKEKQRGKSGGRQHPAKTQPCPQGWRATHRKGVRSKGSHTPAHFVLIATQGDQ